MLRRSPARQNYRCRRACSTVQYPQTYDLIVSNPPYFSGSSAPPDPLRTTARHDATLTYDDLLLSTRRLLIMGGFVIIPISQPMGLLSWPNRMDYIRIAFTRFITREAKNQNGHYWNFFTRIHHAIDYPTLYASENQWRMNTKLTGNSFLSHLNKPCRGLVFFVSLG